MMILVVRWGRKLGNRIAGNNGIDKKGWVAGTLQARVVYSRRWV